MSPILKRALNSICAQPHIRRGDPVLAMTARPMIGAGVANADTTRHSRSFDPDSRDMFRERPPPAITDVRYVRQATDSGVKAAHCPGSGFQLSGICQDRSRATKPGAPAPLRIAFPALNGAIRTAFPTFFAITSRYEKDPPLIMVRIFSHWFPANSLFQWLVDLTLIAMSLVLATTWLTWEDMGGIGGAVLYGSLVAAGLMLVYSVLGVYRRGSRRFRLGSADMFTLCLLLVVPLAYGLGKASPSALWQEKFGLAVLLSAALVSAARACALRRGSGPLLVRRVMVLGTGTQAAAVERSLAESGQDVVIVGCYPVRSDETTQVSRHRILPESCSLAAEAKRLRVDEIIVAVREQRADAGLARELLDCRLAGMRVLDLSSYFERAMGQVRLDSLRASWLIFGDGFRQGLLRKVVKRVFDVCVVLLLLAVCWPVMLIAAILIVLESGVPVFYSQERVGRGNRLFRVLKFRTMRRDAEHDGTPRWASSNDTRVTRVGRVLRRLRIDELPQIWNVLRGDMSLCGPRPERPHFVDQLTREIPFYGIRHAIKPGITGWAQVRYRYGESIEDAAQKLQYDLYYVKNHTLLLDAVVLVKTVGVVLTGAGAR